MFPEELRAGWCATYGLRSLNAQFDCLDMLSRLLKLFFHPSQLEWIIVRLITNEISRCIRKITALLFNQLSRFILQLLTRCSIAAALVAILLLKLAFWRLSAHLVGLAVGLRLVALLDQWSGVVAEDHAVLHGLVFFALLRAILTADIRHRALDVILRQAQLIDIRIEPFRVPSQIVFMPPLLARAYILFPKRVPLIG